MAEKTKPKSEQKPEKIKNTNKTNNFEQRKRRIKKLFKKQKRKISFKRVVPGKKEKLAKQARRTKWAPVWVVLKKFGPGKRIHPSAITKYKRSWRRGKLHIRPKKMRPLHYG
ncbi:hypothetical protein HYS72_01455 [Candidatus Pacearchaeota archaeon]|nr:hypothetical protein [Candidatus Pacearchaeota archaeon]MBI2057276.1 hypothetical protein [Candidatus Pacearchaeota archaeon]